MITIQELRVHAHAFAAETKQEFHHFVDYVQSKVSEKPAAPAQPETKLEIDPGQLTLDLTRGGTSVSLPSDSAVANAAPGDEAGSGDAAA